MAKIQHNVGWFRNIQKHLKCDRCMILLQLSFINDTKIAYSNSVKTACGFRCAKCQAIMELKHNRIKITPETIKEYLNKVGKQHNIAPLQVIQAANQQ